MNCSEIKSTKLRKNSDSGEWGNVLTDEKAISNQYLIKKIDCDSEIDVMYYEYLCEQISEKEILNFLPENIGNEYETLSNKLFVFKGVTFFAYLLQNKISKKIEQFYLSISNEKGNLLIGSNELKINPNLSKVTGFQNFSNYFVLEEALDSSLIVGLVVSNHVFILKIYLEIANFEIIFKKDFPNKSVLLFLGKNNLGSELNFNFCVIELPKNNLIRFNCDFRRKSPIISFTKIALSSICSSNLKENPIKISGDIIYIHKKQINKILITKISQLHENQKDFKDDEIELKFAKNFFSNTIDDKHYLLTDNVNKSKNLELKIYNVDPNNNVNKLKLLQTIVITKKDLTNGLGEYTANFITNKIFFICFFETEELFLLKFEQTFNCSNPNFLVQTILHFNIPEFFSWSYDFCLETEILTITEFSGLLYKRSKRLDSYFNKNLIPLNSCNNNEMFINSYDKSIEAFSHKSSPLTSNSVKSKSSKSQISKMNESNKKSKNNSSIKSNDSKNIKVKEKPTIIEEEIVNFLANTDKIEDENDTKEKNSTNNKLTKEYLPIECDHHALENKFMSILENKLSAFTDVIANKIERSLLSLNQRIQDVDDIRNKNNQLIEDLAQKIVDINKKEQNTATYGIQPIIVRHSSETDLINKTRRATVPDKKPKRNILNPVNENLINLIFKE